MHKNSQTLNDLAGLPIFAAIPAEHAETLTAAGKARPLKKGDQLFMHGQALSHVYIVVSGAIREFRETPDGKEFTLHLALRGDLLGASHLFDATCYQWSAQAAEHSLVHEYPAHEFRQQLKSNAALAIHLLAALSQRAHLAALDSEHRITLSAPQRIACFLLRLCSLYGFDPRQFTLPFSKSTIASTLGMEQETLSRGLQKLRKLGVEVKAAAVSIRDAHALECYVCGHCSLSEDCTTLATLHSACEGRNG